MTDASVQAIVRLGFRVTDGASWKRAVEDFQRGYALPGRPALHVDGVAGKVTRAAIAECDARRKAGHPTASKWFSFTDFRCKCGGRYARCHVVLVHRDLLVGLDRYRDSVGKPVKVVSGYRCPTHNAKVGGATSSQHLYGAAADLEYLVSTTVMRRLRRFSGIGQSASSRKVRHVDVRHLSGHNTTGGTPDRPTVWNYAS
jgi:zinc D-Ala-D-Ala carboxypeptidase